MQQKKETRKPFIEHWQVIKAMLVVYDVISIAAAYFIALLLRFDFHYSEIPYGACPKMSVNKNPMVAN